MKLNKLFSLIILICLIPFKAYSMNTIATLYDRDSFIVTTVNHLALNSKVTGIYDNYPTTAASVLYTFNKIDRASLSKIDKSLYDKVEKELFNKDNLLYSNENFAFNINLPITFEGFFYETNDNSKLKYYELDNQYKDISPWLDLNTQLYFGQNIVGYSQFAIKDKLNYTPIDYASSIETNLDSFFLLPTWKNNFEIHYPFKIGLSIGDEHYNFQIGKNRLSSGSGITGNFFIGDNFSKQDYMAFSLLSSKFSYTINVTAFDQQSSSLEFSPISFNGKQQYRVMHKAKINLLKNFSLDIYQGALFQVSTLNFRMLIPFMFVHNYYNFKDNKIIKANDEANNILGFQTTWVINEGNELNFIISFDQIQVFESGEEFPSSYGFLINYKNSKSKTNGIISKNIEVVYTSPYLYLNEKYDSFIEGDEEVNLLNYNYDYILGYNYGKYSEIGYGGYIYGPDAIVSSASFKYSSFQNWNIASTLLFKIKGTKGIKTNKEDTDNDIIGKVISSIIVGTPQITISLTQSGGIELTDKIYLATYISLNSIINHYNNDSIPSDFNVQGKIIAKINLI